MEIEKEVYYRIGRGDTTDDKKEAKAALLQKQEVVKVVRISYETGPTRVINATLTTIKRPKDL